MPCILDWRGTFFGNLNMIHMHFRRLALGATMVGALLSACGGSDDKPAIDPATLPAVSTAPAGGQYAANARVDEYIQRMLRESKIPGLSLAVMENGKVLYAKAYGYANLENAVAATPEHRFEIGSVTKSFAAVGIMLLVQDGKIELDQKISTYLGPVPAAWEPITVRQLLTHTSGIAENLDGSDKIVQGTKLVSEADVVEFTKQMPLKLAPGTAWSYSNIAYDVVGALIAKVSGKNYGAFLQERVFGPLDMRSTRIMAPHDVGAGAATGYVKNGNGFTPYVQSPAHRSLLALAASGMESTALDLAKFDAALYSDTLLTANTRSQMWAGGVLVQAASSATDSAVEYGLGWYLSTVDGHRKVYHSGGMPAFITDFIRYPDDGISVVVLTNQGSIGREPQLMSRYVARMFRPGLPYCCDAK